MRTFLIIAAATLLAFGCDKKEDQGTSTPPKNTVAKEQQPEAAQEPVRTPETRTDETAKKSEVDPAFKDYEYPTSTLEDSVSKGNTVSVIYKSPHEFAKVVEFYKQKFPDAPDQPGTTVYFVKTNADGSALTVTLTKLDNETQIILKQEKKSL